MAESYAQINEGTGKKLHTFERTIGSNTIQEDVVLLGEHYLAHYFVSLAGSSVATTDAHLVQVMAGASLKVYIRRIRVHQTALSSADGLLQLQLFRLTTAGTGGTSVTPQPFETTDAPSGATAMALPTVKGTEASVPLIRSINLGLVAAHPIPTGGYGFWEWTQLPSSKAIVIPAGTANGVALKVIDAEAGATCGVLVEFAEANF